MRTQSIDTSPAAEQVLVELLRKAPVLFLVELHQLPKTYVSFDKYICVSKKPAWQPSSSKKIGVVCELRHEMLY
jgi:hypothetical protein